MTIAEISRYINSYNRQYKYKQKQDAINIYLLADLVGASVGRLYKGKFPRIQEVFPSLFEEDQLDEEYQKKKDEISAQRFLQFAEAFNKNFSGGVVND